MDKRSHLKAIVTRHAESWASVASPSRFRGQVKVETRNTVYQFRDGVCFAVTRREAGEWRQSPTTLIGMRLIGWMLPYEPEAGLLDRWRPGAYAVLYKPNDEGMRNAAVALTSATVGFARRREPMTSPAIEPSPIPRAMASAPANDAISAEPPSVAPPAPPSGTRIHAGIPSPQPMVAANAAPDSISA